MIANVQLEMESANTNKRPAPTTTQTPTQTPRKHKKRKVISSKARLAKQECDRCRGKTSVVVVCVHVESEW